MIRIFTGVLLVLSLLTLANCSSGGRGSAVNVSPTQILGMTARPSNTSCVAPDRPGAGGATALSVVRALPNINFKPTANDSLITGAFMPHSDAASSRWYVTSLDGHVYAVNNSDSATSFSTFADISSRTRYSSGAETGLYGIAFHPNYPTNPRVYVTYSTTSPTGGVRGRVSEFRTLDGGNTLDPSTEVVLLTIDQPNGDHNGGFIGFSPNDGDLYVSLGDGGGVYDPHGTIGNGQDTTTLLGKVVRIDVDHPSASLPYSIPADNPYAGNPSCSATGAGSANCPEIYAYGLRNPWRGSFDRQSGQLWMSDNGEDSWEEVDRINLGGNYGWRCREGANSTGLACGTATSFIDPVAQYAHPTAGRSVIGGFVYHGTKYPALAGSYVFGDLYGNLFKIPSTTSPTLTLTVVDATSSGLTIVSLAEDNSGELYVVDLNGTLWRLQSSGSGVNTISDSLLATGCISTTAPTEPASGLIPYVPNAPFWSDGASKRRWIAIPDGSQISTSTLADGDWEFPVGTVLVKDFSLNNALVETRLFMRHTDGSWAGYSYEWNDAHTDATRVVGGKDKAVGTQTWHFPSESECMQCHSAAAGYSLGPETGQLNGNYAYPSTPSPPFTGTMANQLDTLSHIGLFTPAIGSAGAYAYPDPLGSAGTVAERARAYLHTNCSQCHRPSGGTPVSIDLRYQATAAMSGTGTCAATPLRGDLGVSGAKIIDPGSPATSVLYLRMHTRGANQMPPIASTLVDAAGASLLSDWITQMSATCN